MPDHTHDNTPFNASDIKKYWKGELSAVQMNAMERAALDDPFLADAMDGYRQLQHTAPDEFKSQIEDLESRLSERIGQRDQRDPTVLMELQKRRKGLLYQWWKPAVAAMLIITAGAISFWLMNSGDKNIVSKLEPAVVAVPEKSNTDSIVIPVPEPVAEEAPDLVRATKEKTIIQRKSEALEQKSILSPAPSEDIPVPTEGNVKRYESSAIRESELEVPAARQKIALDSSALAKKDGYFMLKGTVLDEKKIPIEGVIVALQGKAPGIAVVTDQQGKFTLPVTDPIVQLNLSTIGYDQRSERIVVTDTAKNYAFSLTPSNSTLDEVVVVGYGTQRKKSVTGSVSKITKNATVKHDEAMPSNGWAAYQEYLSKNKMVPDSLTSVKGNVLVRFNLDKKGLLHSFRIEQSLHPVLDQEAIRLIKSGPGWKMLKGRRPTVIVSVPF